MKNKLLVVNFFPAFYPPSSGGEQRYYYFYFYLSHYFDITLLSPTYQYHDYEVINFNDNFREHRVPKEPIYTQLHQKMNQCDIGPECSGLVVALAGGVPNNFHDAFLKLSIDADIIIHECPFTLPYDLHFGLDNKPRIYNSYNVEFLLMKQILQGPLKTIALNFTKTLERNLLEKADLVLATSDEEKLLFCNIYKCELKSIYLAPNGFEPHSHDLNTIQNLLNHLYLENKPYIFFMGSGHPPNIEAGRFIIEKIAPQLPNYNFVFIGSVCKSFKDISGNIKLLGFVSEADKIVLLTSCSVAINPMISGAGTNLKMLDYMAAGAPIITTKIGARGLSLTNGSEALIVDIEEFPTAINKILSDQQLSKQLGSSAKQTAYNHYTWQSIAKSVAPLITDTIYKKSLSIVKNRNKYTKLLVVNDFPISNAIGGGQIRIKELLTDLSDYYDIIFLCLSNSQEYTETIINDCFLEICIPKTPNHRLAENEKNAISYISVNDIVAADYCLKNPIFIKNFLQHTKTAKAIIFEHPYLAPLLTLIQSNNHIIVYSSLNCELQLKQQILQSRSDFQLLIGRVKELEEILLQKANLVTCVSKADRDTFALQFPHQRYLVIENGVRLNCYDIFPENLLDNLSIDDRQFPLVLFVGSSHTPNIDAVYYIRDILAPALPDIIFGIIGSVCDALNQDYCPQNIILFGVLDVNVKNLLMKKAAVAINPMFTGGGSSLKVPDFLAAGLPLISTDIGVRGYDLHNETHYLLADSLNFIERIRFLISDIKLQSYLRQNSISYIKQNLDWAILSNRYKMELEKVICFNPIKLKRKLLVVTYRFTDPPLGGAEVYLNNILREISAIGNFIIDVATYDVGKLFNKWHFSADYLPVYDQVTSKPNYLHRLTRFSLDTQNQEEVFLKCHRLFSLWMKESLSHSLEFLDLLLYPTLLGGWNFPEQNTDGTYARWSSKTASIFLGSEAKSLRIKGTVAHKGKLNLFIDEILIKGEISNTFSLQFALPEKSSSILYINIEGPVEITNDVRELGAYFTSIEVANQFEWYSIKLEEDYTTIARLNNVERWVQSLIHQTTLRDVNDDSLFIDVRGPKSTDLLTWLNENISNYEIVLIQGIPFSSSVSTFNIAQKNKIPCVLLPHYHMEDKYYHWHSFYQTFQKSSLVLVAPNISKNIFFDKLNARSVCVLGGAANPAEFSIENIELGKRTFKHLHRSGNPFILYLGRKSGGKNYQLIIQALALVAKFGYCIDLVMIGPDEDQLVLNTSNVYYYGLQPRIVVIGALAECLCVINMSTSESFGIVLIEAWLAGRPVIAQRNCVAFAELVQENKNGFLAQTPEEISKYIIQYLTNHDFTNHCGANGRETAKPYTWLNLASQINTCLLQVLGVELEQFEKRSIA